MSFKTNIKNSFKAAKKDLVETRQTLTNSVLQLSNEIAKLHLRIIELERKIPEQTSSISRSKIRARA